MCELETERETERGRERDRARETEAETCFHNISSPKIVEFKFALRSLHF